MGINKNYIKTYKLMEYIVRIIYVKFIKLINKYNLLFKLK